MEQLTTYRAKGKEIGLVFLFKYDLKGHLKGFYIEEGELDGRQMKWLFSPNFPANESIMRSIWMKEERYKKVFDVTVTPADVSFEAFWKLYPYNKLSNKQTAKARFIKLKEAEIIKLFNETPEYIKQKKLENQFFPYCEVYIKSRWWDR